MRSLLPAVAIASTLVAACGSGPARAPDAFFEGFDAGPADAPFADAFRAPVDAFMPLGTDTGMTMGMTDSGPIDGGMMMGMTDAGMDAAMGMTDSGPMATGDAGNDASLMAPANDTCGGATVILAGTTMGSSLGAVNDYGTGTNCAGVAGVDVVYAVDVAAGYFLRASVESGDGTFDPSISLVDTAACDATPRVCLDGDDSGGTTMTNVVDYRNTTSATVRMYLVVDTYSTTSLGGPFDLTVELAAPAANDTCATAIMVGAGTTMGSAFGAANDYGAGTNCAGFAGGDVAYAIDVPAGQIALVSVESGDGSFDPSISLVDSACGGTPRTCLDGDDSGGATTINSADYRNSTGGVVRIYAIVDTYSSTSIGGIFDLTVSFASPPTNETCATAMTVGAGTYMGTTLGAVNDYGSGTGCSGVVGGDVAYAIAVPAGERVIASVVGSGGFNASLNLVAGPAATCGGTPRVCLDSADSTAPAIADVVDWVNDTGTATTVFAIVDSNSPSTVGAFTLTVTVGPPPAGDICASADRVTAGATAGTTLGMRGDYGTGTMCAGAAGVERVYVVNVGAGVTLGASVTTGLSTFDPSISLERACGVSPRVCLAGDDTGSELTVNTVSYRNTSLVAEDIFIVIDTFSTTSMGGPFTLDVTLTGP